MANAREEFRGLSGRSMEAIKATLDGGLVREVQRLNSQLVFLTIGIAGGPYLGLLGTVIGVMITFAVIAKSGAVEVNSIAPGIAGALLATVAGLAVAIPCLFAYSYISTRIKDAVSDMQVFIDEFVAILEAQQQADVVEDFAVKLPLATICDIMGLPVDDWSRIHTWTGAFFESEAEVMRLAHAGETLDELRLRLSMEFYEYCAAAASRARAAQDGSLTARVASGEVEGDARVDLQFSAGDINDLIKSLVIHDAKGKSMPLRYDSQEPIEKTLKSFAIDLSTNPSFGQILNQMRGQKGVQETLSLLTMPA